MRFIIEYKKYNWRDKIVTHRTPTGRISRVKVGSLPPDEQLKYNPNRIKRMKLDMKLNVDDVDQFKKVKVIDMYVASKGLKNIKSVIKKHENKLILAATDSDHIFNLFDDQYDIIKLEGVPLKCIKKYIKHPIDGISNIDNINFIDVKDENDDEVYEFIKYKDLSIVLVDLYTCIDVVNIIIDYIDNDEDDLPLGEK